MRQQKKKKRKERGKETHYSTLNYVTASSSIGILTCTPCSAFRSTASSGHIRFTLLSEKGPRCACFALCISACFSSLHCPLSALSAFQLYCFIVLFFFVALRRSGAFPVLVSSLATAPTASQQARYLSCAHPEW